MHLLYLADLFFICRGIDPFGHLSGNVVRGPTITGCFPDLVVVDHAIGEVNYFQIVNWLVQIVEVP